MTEVVHPWFIVWNVDWHPLAIFDLDIKSDHMFSLSPFPLFLLCFLDLIQKLAHLPSKMMVVVVRNTQLAKYLHSFNASPMPFLLI